MLSDGLLNKQIAYELNVSEATIKAHMTAIFRKLNVKIELKPLFCSNSENMNILNVFSLLMLFIC